MHDKRPEPGVYLDTMSKVRSEATMTELLREALKGVESVRAVARAVGVAHPSLVRFRAGKQDLKLGSAEKLAAYFGIEVRTRKGK